MLYNIADKCLIKILANAKPFMIRCRTNKDKKNLDNVVMGKCREQVVKATKKVS